jgi:quercetin dioxygenase-like cupin family protein
MFHVSISSREGSGVGTNKRNTSMKKLTLVLTLLLTPSPLLAQMGSDPSEPTIFRIDDIPYKTQSTPFGNLEIAIIFGDPTKAGPYVQRIKFPPRMEVKPHSHGKDELKIVSLLEGELLFGYLGEEGEAMKPGNIWTESMGLVHFGLAGDKGAVIEIFGIGPVSSTPHIPD